MTYQLTASLLTAVSTRVREVRITRLVESTFYAMLLPEGPGGAGEVDARPSDAVNLAVVTSASIMVSADVLDDVRATGRTDWQTYSTTRQQLVYEMLRQHEELIRCLDPS